MKYQKESLDLNKLCCIVTAYRGELETLISSEPENYLQTDISSFGKPFPFGCCLNSSKILAEFLSRHFGMNSLKLVSSNGNEHYWLEYAETIYIDITADQFDTKNISPTIVDYKEKCEFHKHFEVKGLKKSNLFEILHHHPISNFAKRLEAIVIFKSNRINFLNKERF